jgi:hypothetical protein
MDERPLLYPSIDCVRSNYHGSKTIIKKPVEKPKKMEESPIKESILNDTKLVDTKKANKGISIAPRRFSCLSDIELERVIRNEIRKYPHLVRRGGKIRDLAKFNVVEKNIHGVKITSAKNESKLKFENEIIESRRPNVFTYHYSDKKVHPNMPEFSFA